MTPDNMRCFARGFKDCRFAAHYLISRRDLYVLKIVFHPLSAFPETSQRRPLQKRGGRRLGEQSRSHRRGRRTRAPRRRHPHIEFHVPVKPISWDLGTCNNPQKQNKFGLAIFS